MNINVLVNHCTPLLQAGLTSILSAHPDIDTEPSPHDLPDVVLVDLARFLAAGGGWRSPVIIVAPPGCGRDVRLASKHGARGFLDPACPEAELIDAVHAVAGGHRYFGGSVTRYLADGLQQYGVTAREYEVLLLLAEGGSNKQIALELAVGEGTVKSHVKSLLHKLEVSSRTQAVVVAMRSGLI